MRATFLNDEVSRDLDECIDFARSEGVDAIELRMIGDANVVTLPAAEQRELAAKLARAGLRVVALSTPLFKIPLEGDADPDDPDPFRAVTAGFEEHLELIPRAADAARLFGAPMLRCFAFLGRGDYRDVRAPILARLRSAGERLARHAPGLRFGLENEHTTYVRTAEEVADAVRALGDPFDVLWDPGNAFVAGERRPTLGFEAVAGLVGHIHVKDPLPDGDGLRFVPLGQGAIDYRAQAAAWARSGYRGFVGLEPHLIVGRSSIPGARACLDALRPLLADAVAGAERSPT